MSQFANRDLLEDLPENEPWPPVPPDVDTATIEVETPELSVTGNSMLYRIKGHPSKVYKFRAKNRKWRDIFLRLYDGSCNPYSDDSAANDSTANDPAANASAANSTANDSAAANSTSNDSAANDSISNDSAANDSAANDSAANDSAANDSAAAGSATNDSVAIATP
ncbi:hypothetical protein C8A00DRAFT_33081 [Chaetomidium leptoderma]|uniref:Uncharacterized protein n=1 Tax=Chaetomidium leptoderma TaxID=669021 RepID=A0AAN6VMY4_9PEZI|nr:hypothetical protein C8A00DRAFT_33081 [Chaetomidium leptoderma]